MGFFYQGVIQCVPAVCNCDRIAVAAEAIQISILGWLFCAELLFFMLQRQ